MIRKSRPTLTERTAFPCIPSPLQPAVVGDDILIMPVFHKETARYGPELHKAQLFIKPQRVCISADHGVELKDTESQFSPLLHTVSYQDFSDMLPPHIRAHRIARIADMTAASDIIGM